MIAIARQMEQVSEDEDEKANRSGNAATDL